MRFFDPKRGDFLISASLLGLLLSAGAAVAGPLLPSGGSVAAGSAAISTSGSSLTVSQSTPKAIIDWSGFSIGQGGSVQFNNGSGATLNRVTGSSASSIDGLLNGTGSVYLINPNGVIVGKTGEVNVGGTFVASTLDVPNASFLAGGNLTFSGPSTAAVVNEGKVGSLGGDVVLIASSVSNSGSLSAPDGTVGLLAGQSVLLRDQALDDGKFSVLVGGPSTSETNSGLIEAANAELRANGGNIYALAGNTAGTIRATGVKRGDGHVWLMSGDEGATNVAGEITARGPNGSGGTIETSGAEVKIGSSSIDAGLGGTWLVDPYDLTIDTAAASSINGALNVGTNVTEQTTASGASGFGNQNPSGNGDIFVRAPISWSTGATLTMDAYRNISITAPITVSGAGKVNLTTGAGGALDFGLTPSGFAGNLGFTGTEGSGQALTINGTAYGLIYSAPELVALNGRASHAALAQNLTVTANNTVVGIFGGTLEGLGHAVTNQNTTSRNGLFDTLNPGGTIADLGVIGSTISGGGSTLGALVDDNLGNITRSYATGAVTLNPMAGSTRPAGGLVGSNNGSISWSFAAVSVGGAAADPGLGEGGSIALGGLVGTNTNSISHSYALGAVSGPDGKSLGGLVGENDSTGVISFSYATGPVSGAGTVSNLGGLVGYSDGSIDHAYSSGSVTAPDGQKIGGLVGNNGESSGRHPTISQSYATGAVEGSAEVGGAIGYDEGGVLTALFAIGAVTAGSPTDAGGFAGKLQGSMVSQSFAIGVVNGGQPGGGFVGSNVSSSFSSDYWNTGTSGKLLATNSGSVSGVTGLPSAQLKDALPAGFSSSDWGQITGVSYPYQLSLFPTTPEVISGTVTGSGVTPGYTLSAIVNGATNIGSVNAGADLTFYFLEPAGTLPQGSTAAVYIAHEPKKSAQVIEDIGAGSSLTGLYLTASSVAISTRDTTLSAMIADLAKGLGPATTAAGADILFGVSGSSLTLASQATSLGIFPGGSGFVFDQDLNLGTSRLLAMVSYNGPITQTAGSITVGKLGGSSTGGLSLTSSGNQIGQIVGWSDGSGSISVTDAARLVMNGTVQASNGVDLTDTGAGMVISQPVQAGADGVTLGSSGYVWESGAGAISTSGALTVSTAAGIKLNGANLVGSASLTNGSAGGVAYAELGDLDLASTSNAGTGAVTIGTTLDGSGHGDIDITGSASGRKLVLNAAGGLGETGSGVIAASILSGSASGAVTLGGANQITEISGFTATEGFSLTNARAVNVTKATTLDGSGQTVSLTTTAGNLVISGTVLADTLNLTSQAGSVNESATTGAVRVGTLNVNANSGITLTSPSNEITTVGVDHTNSGPNHIVQ